PAPQGGWLGGRAQTVGVRRLAELARGEPVPASAALTTPDSRLEYHSGPDLVGNGLVGHRHPAHDLMARNQRVLHLTSFTVPGLHVCARNRRRLHREPAPGFDRLRGDLGGGELSGLDENHGLGGMTEFDHAESVGPRNGGEIAVRY